MKLEVCIILKLFLNFSDSELEYSYKLLKSILIGKRVTQSSRFTKTKNVCSFEFSLIKSYNTHTQLIARFYLGWRQNFPTGINLPTRDLNYD